METEDRVQDLTNRSLLVTLERAVSVEEAVHCRVQGYGVCGGRREGPAGDAGLKDTVSLGQRRQHLCHSTHLPTVGYRESFC